MIENKLNKFFTLRTVRHWHSCPEELWMSLKVFKDRLDKALNMFLWKMPMAVALELDDL